MKLIETDVSKARGQFFEHYTRSVGKHLPAKFNIEHAAIRALEASCERCFKRTRKCIPKNAELGNPLGGRWQNVLCTFSKAVLNRPAVEGGHNHARLDSRVCGVAFRNHFEHDDLPFHIARSETKTDALVLFVIPPLLRRTETRVRVVKFCGHAVHDGVKV